MDLLVAIKVVALLALIAFIILSIFMMVSLSSATKLLKETNSNLNVFTRKLLTSVDEIKEEMKSLNSKTQETLNNFDVVANNLKVTSKRVDAETERIVRTIEPFQDLLRHSYDRVAPPVNNATKTIAAVSKAVTTFFDHFGKNNKK